MEQWQARLREAGDFRFKSGTVHWHMRNAILAVI